MIRYNVLAVLYDARYISLTTNTFEEACLKVKEMLAQQSFYHLYNDDQVFVAKIIYRSWPDSGPAVEWRCQYKAQELATHPCPKEV